MKISLGQVEIEAALRAYVTSQGINTAGKLVLMDFTMGRKGTGLTVDVNITAPRENVVVTEESIAVAAVATPTVVAAEPETTEVEEVQGFSTAAPTTASLFS